MQTRGRYKGVLLYPEQTEHINAYNIIKANYSFASIVHDRDINEDGELKKVHMHVIIRLQNTQENSSLAKNLGIREGLVCNILSLKGSLEYLIHFNNPDKYQYPLDCVYGDLKPTLIDFINSGIPECERFKQLLYLINNEKPTTTYQLTMLCVENGYYDLLRKNSYLLIQLIKK